MIVIDPFIILLISLIFGVLNVSERVLYALYKRGLLKKLYKAIYNKKIGLEESLKISHSILENQTINELEKEEYSNVVSDVIDLTHSVLELVKI